MFFQENIFNLKRLRLGLCYLDKAMVGGHDAATYTMGILFFRDHRTRQTAMEFLNKIGASGTNDSETKILPSLCAVRTKVLKAVRMITMNRWSPGRREQCANPSCGVEKGWDARQSFCSDLCKWTSEYFRFYEEMWLSNLLMTILLDVFPWSQTT